MLLANPLLKKFNRTAFPDSSEFPEDALASLTSDLGTLFDQGNEGLFKEFKDNLPRLYDILTTECGRVHLLEQRAKSLTSDKENIVYCWVLETPEEELLYCGIPRNRPKSALLRFEKNFLACLPSFLLCFLKSPIMGMGFSDIGGLPGSDFPRDHWSGLYEMGDNMDIPQLKQNLIFDIFPEDDLRVLIKCSNSDLVAVNFTTKDRNLYYIKYNDPQNYQIIENAKEVMEDYFIDRIRGVKRSIL